MTRRNLTGEALCSYVLALATVRDTFRRGLAALEAHPATPTTPTRETT